MLPVSRNRTYGADTKVHSADLNDIQDCIIGGIHGARTKYIGPSRWVGSNNQDITYSIDSAAWPTGTSSSFGMSPDLDLGTIITEIRVRVKGKADNVVEVAFTSDLAGVPTTLASELSVTPDVWETVTLTGPFPAMVSGKDYLISVAKDSGSFTADEVGRVEIDYYRP